MKTFTVAVTSFLAVAGLVTAIPMPQDSESPNPLLPVVSGLDQNVRQAGPVSAANAGQAMADPGDAAEAAVNGVGGLRGDINQNIGAAATQDTPQQVQNTGNLRAVLANVEGGERK